MAEEPQGGDQPPAAPEIPVIRIAQDVPTVFCDGVMSQSFAFGVTKIYFYRIDPDPRAASGPREIVTAQLIMPSANFLRTAAFFEHRIRLMIQSGEATAEAWEAARQYWVDNPRAGMKDA